jgi:hypothetical protein
MPVGIRIWTYMGNREMNERFHRAVFDDPLDGRSRNHPRFRTDSYGANWSTRTSSGPAWAVSSLPSMEGAGRALVHVSTSAGDAHEGRIQQDDRVHSSPWSQGVCPRRRRHGGRLDPGRHRDRIQGRFRESSAPPIEHANCPGLPPWRG